MFDCIRKPIFELGNNLHIINPHTNLYNNLIPTNAPPNNAIINTQPDRDSDAVAIKKAAMLHPPAMHAP